MSGDFRRGYVDAKFYEEQELSRIQNELYNELCIDDYSIDTPHITIYPCFNIKKGNEPSLISLVDEHINLEGKTVKITGVDLWPSEDNPRVILLNVNLDINDEREVIKTYINNNDGTTIGRLSPTHISLLKSDSMRHIDDEDKKFISDIISDIKYPTEVTIKYVDVVF